MFRSIVFIIVYCGRGRGDPILILETQGYMLLTSMKVCIKHPRAEVDPQQIKTDFLVIFHAYIDLDLDKEVCLSEVHALRFGICFFLIYSDCPFIKLHLLSLVVY